MILILRAALALLCSCSLVAVDWQLADGDYQPRVQDMRIVCPRPDSETGVTAADTTAKAAHALAMPGRPYRMPIGVAFGSWPFRYELVSGPSGMRVGAQFGDADYGYVIWDTAVAGHHLVRLRVYDQEYQRGANPSGYAEVVYTLNCDASLFVVLQPGMTFADIHQDDEADATYKDKAVWIRGGTYAFSAPGGGNHLWVNNKPKIWLKDPGEDHTIDFSAGQFAVGNLHQAWFDLGYCINSCQSLDDSHFIFFASYAQDRCGITIKRMSHVRRGVSGGDNPAGVTLFAAGTVRADFYVGHTEITDNTAPLVDSYGCSGLIEEIYGHDNVYSGGGDGQIVFPKAGNVNLCIRRLIGRNITGNNCVYLLGGYNPVAQRNIEVSWSTIHGDGIAINTNNAGIENTVDYTRNIWIFRNTIVGSVRQSFDETWPQAAHANQIYLSNNVIVSNDVFSNGTPIMPSNGNRIVVASGNVAGPTSAGILDSDDLLTGSSRSTYLGRVGAEVVTTAAPPIAPTITTQPADQTVMTGATVTFSVVATGTPLPNYQWRRDGTAISGATSASYTTPTTILAESGSVFTVVVSNSAGSLTSANAVLTVQGSGSGAGSLTSANAVLAVQGGGSSGVGGSGGGSGGGCGAGAVAGWILGLGLMLRLRSRRNSTVSC